MQDEEGKGQVVMQTDGPAGATAKRGANIARQAGPATDAAAIEDFYRRNYIAAQYVFVQFFAEHLADLSRAFRGDLQTMLILATLGQVHLDRARRALDPFAPDEAPAGVDLGWTTSSRLADVTGIPRQTVRRKLAGLAKRGWVIQNDQQGWELSRADGPRVRDDLAELDVRAMKRVSRLIADFNGLLSRTLPAALLVAGVNW